MDYSSQQQQQSARALLGLAPSPARERDLSVSVASSADSADVAGGRAGFGPRTISSSSRDRDGSWRVMVPGQGLPEDSSVHLHPSRALWVGRATPSPSPTPPPPRTVHSSSNSVSSSFSGSSNNPPFVSGGNRDRQGRQTSGGSSVVPDTFWSPVLPESGPAPPIDSNSWGGHLSWQQRQNMRQQRVAVTTPTVSYGLAPPSKYEQQLAAAAVGGIDRPALRGQEYRREKKGKGKGSKSRSAEAERERHRHGRNSSSSSPSSLLRSGSGLGAPDEDRDRDSASRGFLGIRWPPLLSGGQRGRSDTNRSIDIDADVPGGYSGGSLDSGRLRVSLEGTQELGKGLSGHTVYRIQVSDRAAGDQWMVLRRFRQFEELHRGLLPVLSREPDANAYALPPKEVFGGRHGGVIAKRLKLLKVYLDRLVTCSAAVAHRTMTSFLELDPTLRGLGAYGRQHGPECVLKEGELRIKSWKGPYKPVINILEAGLQLIGWTSSYAIVSPGPVFLVYHDAEDDPEKPLWVLPARRTIGSQVRVRRVDMWKADLEKEGTRLFLVSWDNTSLLCQVDSEASLDSWARALDENVDLRPQQSEEDRAKVDIELKAKEMWNTRQEGLWGGL